MNMRLKADFMLLLITMAWGASYYLSATSMKEMGPIELNAWRFLTAFFVALAATFPRLKNVNRETLKYSAILGIVLVFVFLSANYGLLYTKLSNAGFLCALSVVFTPILGRFFFKKELGRKMLFVIAVACAGMALLTLGDDFSFAPGDLLCLICAVSYSADLLITERAVRLERVDALQLGVFQLGFTGLFMFALTAALETPHLPQQGVTWTSMLFLAIFCTGVPCVVQTVAQKYTDAAHVGVIFALEPVFSGIVAFVFAGERLSTRAYFGAALLIFSIFFMEAEPGKINWGGRKR
ncbi:MAG: DMT family transporter [Clostridiales Family XIII bacterium]|nr:DMT family transporter [Clostridiales Family XIII bacterium]